MTDCFDSKASWSDVYPPFIITRPVQVRFHGKTSGLHLLGRSDRTDHRNEGRTFCWAPRSAPPLFNCSLIHRR